MSELKHCPKCGSINISPLSFYRPSIWKCLQCGYEGALIIEGNMFVEEIQECYRKRCNITGWVEGEPSMDHRDGSPNYWQRL